MNDTCICDNVPKVWRLTGVTRTLRLRIFNPDGTPLDLTGRTVAVTIARDNSEFSYAPGFVVEGDDGNVVKFEWPADKQGAGDYTINVTTTDGSGNVDRVNWHGPTGIRLVDFSFMVRGEDALGVTSEANIGLDGTFTMNGTGMSAYDEWLAEGHTGTPEDFIAWLRQPAVDAASAAEAQMGQIQERADADHTRAGDDHTTAGQDHTRAGNDHATATDDHRIAAADHSTATDDHTLAASDHGTAAEDHRVAGIDHGTAADDHTRAGNDHQTASDDHTQAGSDHTRAGEDHTRAGDDHQTASSDHTRAGEDHTTASNDHTRAGQDHTQAGNDHTRAEADHGIAADDHTQATADHAVMAGYDTRLTNVDGEVTQLGQEVGDLNEAVVIQEVYNAIAVPQGNYITGYCTNAGVFKGIGGSTVFGFHYIAVESGKKYRITGQYKGSTGYAGMVFSANLPATDAPCTVLDLYDVQNETFDVSFTAPSNGYLYVWDGNGTATYSFYKRVVSSGAVNDVDEKYGAKFVKVVLIPLSTMTKITGAYMQIYGKKINPYANSDLYYIPVVAGEKYKLVSTMNWYINYSAAGFSTNTPVLNGNYDAEIINSTSPTDGLLWTAPSNGYLIIGTTVSDGNCSAYSVGEYEFDALSNSIHNLEQEDAIIEGEVSGIKEDVLELNAAVVQVNIELSILGGYIYKNDGIIHDNGEPTSYRISDYIPIGKYKKLECVTVGNNNIANIAFYDSDKNYLSAISVMNNGEKKDTIDLTLPAYQRAFYVIIGTCQYSSFADDIYGELVPTIQESIESALYKKMLCIGDSLTNASNWNVLCVSTYDIAEETTKSGAIGLTMADLPGETSIYSVIQSMTTDNDVDLITVWAGTNDWVKNVSIGDFDTQESATVRDVTTFYGAFIESVEKLLALYPTARIVLVGTTARVWNDGENNYNNTPNGNGKYLREYVDAVKKVAEYYSIPFLDLLRTSGITSQNIAQYMMEQHQDNDNNNPAYWLHFNTLGSQTIAKRISAFINAIG